MRINSEFKDYYDGVMRHGQDSSLVYQRHMKEILLKKYPFPAMEYSTPRITIRNFAIGFCGKVYCGLRLTRWSLCVAPPKFCYDAESVIQFVNDNEDTKFVAEFNSSSRFISRHRGGEHKSTFIKFFEKARKIAHEEYFQNLCPVFTLMRTEYLGSQDHILTLHGQLKQFEFYRVFPPFKAFQEISMWLSNQAVPFKPVPEMDNSTKIAARGFDKFSFRKDKKQ